MRKAVIFMLTVVLICTMVIPASAAGSAAFTISAAKEKGISGDEIQFEVSVSSDAPCTSFGVVLDFDSSIFTITGGTCTLEDALFSVFDEEKGFAYLFEEPCTPNGVIGTFTLRVKDHVPSTDAMITGQTSVQKKSESINSTIAGTSIRIYGTGSSTQIKTDGNSTITQTQPPATEQHSESKPVSQNSPQAENAPTTEAVAQAPTGQSTQDPTSPENTDSTADSGKRTSLLTTAIILLSSSIVCLVVLIWYLKKKR